MIFTTDEIARITGGNLVGRNDIAINSFNRIEVAGQGELTFVASEKYLQYLDNSEVSCVIIHEKLPLPQAENRAYIQSPDPYRAIVQLLEYVAEHKPKKQPAIHKSAVVSDTAVISESAFIGAMSYIGDGTAIGNNVEIHPGAKIAENCKIGDNTIIYPNAVVYADCIIGNRCIIHAGAVIGSDGFGNIENSDGSYRKIPQLGNVIIGDDVEIGANTTIDCALIGSTVIESGVKLDNQIHIGHNCQIGENTAMAAQVGISGSVKIGKRNRLGGQAGLAGHIDTADDVTLLAKSGVAKSIEKKGIYFGSPIKDRLRAFKIEAVINQLPELSRDVADLKRKLNQ